jgi:acetyl coenzyme A synthetase (ADP forming)-like protein
MLDRFFNPGSIAVVGATPKAGKIGNILLTNLSRFVTAAEGGAERRKLFAVNPKYEGIAGIACYPSVTKIPDRVELVIIAIPAEHVPRVLEECGETGITHVVVISAGFKETGREGAILEADLVRLSTRYDLQVIGPNCLGIINTHAGLNATFGTVQPAQGTIAFLSQSGAFILAVIDWAMQAGVGFSKVVSLGNKAVLDESDFIEYLAADDATSVIALYLEDVRDGRRFMDVVRATSRKKPVVVMKSGRTEAGAKAASSHTGSLAGSVEAFRTAFRQAGVVEAHSIEDLFDFSQILSRVSLITGGLAIVTNSGGPGVMAADALEDLGLTLASLKRETIENLRALQLANFYNPIDIRGDADSEKFGAALEIAAADEGVGALIAILSPTAPIDFEKAGDYVLRVNAKKPVIPVFMGGDTVGETVKRLKQHGIANYFDPVRAVQAFSAVQEHSKGREKIAAAPPRFGVDRSVVDQVLALGEREDARMGLGSGGFRILEAYGIPVVPYGKAATAEEVLAIADRTGYPVALKVLSPDIVHKTDVGCVKLGVRREAVTDTFFELLHQAERYTSARRIEGVLVQRMVEGGREVIVGMKQDPHFGPLLMFGLGGLYVEVFKDVSFGIAPLSEDDAWEMIRSVKAYRILRGTRGEPMSDLDSLVDILLRFSQLCIETPELLEVDLNPVKVFERGKGCAAIDVKMVIGAKK